MLGGQVAQVNLGLYRQRMSIAITPARLVVTFVSSRR
jgi:hypothetical protein